MSPDAQAALAVRPATRADAELLWSWANEPAVRAAAFAGDPIAWDEHRAWFEQRLASPACRIYLVHAHGAPAAQVRFDLEAQGEVEIDVSVERTSRGHGIGAEAVRRTCAELFAETGAPSVLARVKAGNAASLHMFGRAGFTDAGAGEVAGEPCRSLRLLHPATDRTYVVAAQRPWNRRVFEEQIAGLPGRWTLVADPAELTPERLGELDPRYVFFLHWSAIVPPSITGSFRCVGFHMSDLPYGRGGSPLQNLIVRGHQETKLSAFGLDQGVDTGPVYAQAGLSLAGSAEEIYVRASELAAGLIRRLVVEEPTPVAQTGEPTPFRRRTPEQSEVPAGASARGLYDHIRMLDAEGYPRAFLVHEGFRYELSQASLLDGAITASVTIAPEPPPA